MAAPEFVAVGHITLDRFGEVTRPGGAALYAAVTAHRLGLSAGILTSHTDDFPLELIPSRIEVVSLLADETTRFEHEERSGRRTMRVPAVAQTLGADDVPADWSDAPLVVLAPVADEVDPLVATAFDNPTLAAAVQGWLRTLGPGGVVEPTAWEPPDFLLGRLQAMFLSVEDVADQEEAVIEWFQRVPVGVLTAGREGALLFVNGDRYEVPPRPAIEVDPTGAGDVFAATFIIHYQRDGDPWEAAAAATCAASLSVEAEGTAGVPDRDTLEAALQVYRRSL